MASQENEKSRSTPLTQWLLRMLSILAWLVTFAAILWSFGALYFHPLLPALLQTILSIGFLVAVGLFAWRIKGSWKKRLAIWGLIVPVYLSWLAIRPNLDREWYPLHEKVASIQINDNQVKITDVRHATYQSETEFKVRYQTRRFHLDQLEEVWFFVQRFTALNSLAHTYLAFGVRTEKGMEYFGVSVEIRSEPDEIYSPTRGLYKQYELMYTISDERDSIGYRTHVRRNDRVYMYRCNATPKQVQAMFRDVAQRVKKLEEQPEFYHTFFNNCTNNIVSHANRQVEKPLHHYDPRIVFPGFSARTAYHLGIIGDEGESFQQLQARSRMDEIARTLELNEDFSTKLRQALKENRND